MTDNPQTTENIGEAVALLKRLGWTVEPPAGERYGCHLELFAMMPGAEPDGCVIDDGLRDNCIYARDVQCKEQCKYWKLITPQSIKEARGEA